MEIKRIVFDVDFTLLKSDFSSEIPYFKSFYSDSDFMYYITDLLVEYERCFYNYDVSNLSSFISAQTGLDIGENVILGWIDLVSNSNSKKMDEVDEVLLYLKNKYDSLAVSSNWFSACQAKRLETAGILHYFDDVYGGDMFLKPYKYAYKLASDKYRLEECVYIGDNPLTDYIGPRAVNMNSILFDSRDRHSNNLVKVKRLGELINIL